MSTGQRDASRFANTLRRHGHGLTVEKRNDLYVVLIDGSLVSRFSRGHFTERHKRAVLHDLRECGIEP